MHKLRALHLPGSGRRQISVKGDPLMETACATVATLAEFTLPELVIPTLTGKATSAVISELAETLHRVKGITRAVHSGLAALNRELLTSMVLDVGAAFPQVKAVELASPVFTVGRSLEPLSWRTKSFPPIQFVFLIALPVQAHRNSGRLIDGLGQLARDVSALCGCATRGVPDKCSRFSTSAGFKISVWQESPKNRAHQQRAVKSATRGAENERPTSHPKFSRI